MGQGLKCCVVLGSCAKIQTMSIPMKVMNQLELQEWVSWGEEVLHGAQLQDVLSFSHGLILIFYKYKTFSLVLDLDNNRPWLYLNEENLAHLKKKKPWPVQLFLNSHAENLRLTSFRVQSHYGRVASLTLESPQRKVELLLILIPKQVNLIVSYEKKQISFVKPQELLAHDQSSLNFESLQVRTIPQLNSEWQRSRLAVANKLNQKTQSESIGVDEKEKLIQQLKKNLEKKLTASEALQKQIQNFTEALRLEELGNRLKTYGLQQEFSEEDKKYLNLKASVSQNIQLLFDKIKLSKKKREGSEARRQELEEEIKNLQLQLNNPELIVSASKSGGKNKETSEKPKFANVKTRKLLLDEETDFYVGKSAVDNLALLRQSRGWDVWFHLKDYPGAYGIIRLNKGKKISQDIVQKCCEFLIKESVRQDVRGLKIAIVYTECRFVRPIKGDKIGRVTYSNASETLFKVS